MMLKVTETINIKNVKNNYSKFISEFCDYVLQHLPSMKFKKHTGLMYVDGKLVKAKKRRS